MSRTCAHQHDRDLCVRMWSRRDSICEEILGARREALELNLLLIALISSLEHRLSVLSKAFIHNRCIISILHDVGSRPKKDEFDVCLRAVDHQPMHVDPTFALKFAPEHPASRIREDIDDLQAYLLTGFECEILQEASGVQAIIVSYFLPPEPIKRGRRDKARQAAAWARARVAKG